MLLRVSFLLIGALVVSGVKERQCLLARLHTGLRISASTHRCEYPFKEILNMYHLHKHMVQHILNMGQLNFQGQQT